MDNGAPPIPPRPPGYETPLPLPLQFAVPATAPPPLPPRQASSSSSHHQSWALPPQPAPPAPPTQPEPEYQATPWSHLSYTNGEPTPLFTALMTDFFAVLDEQKTGYLTPEVFSGFLELNCFTHDEDPWRKNHTPLAAPFLPIDNADFSLLQAYQSYSFPHLVSPTPRSPRRPVLPYGGVPLLSLPGFIAYLSIEFSDDAPARCRGLNRALQHYGDRLAGGWEGKAWRQMGPVPRWCFSQKMPDEVRERVRLAGIRSHEIAREKVEANRVRHEIEAQGRQNALELVSDGRWRWERRY